MRTKTTAAPAAPAAPSPVGAKRAAWLLTRLHLRQQLNGIRAARRFGKASPGRTGTPAKSSFGWLLAVFVVLQLGVFVGMWHQALANMQKVLGSVEVYKDAPRSWLGVQTGPVTPEMADRLGINPGRGAFITGVADGGPAKPAGLQSGDVIVRFDGRDIRDARDLPRVVAGDPVGKTAEVVIVRDRTQQRRTVTPLLRPIAPAPGSVLAPGVLHGATFEATLLLIAVLLMALAIRDIAGPEWDLEWLATLPLPLSTLLLGRLVERAVTNWPGLGMLGPFLSMFAWECGYRWSAPVIGLALTFALLCLASIFQTLADTGLRMSLSRPKLRNLQAVVSVILLLPLFLAMAMVQPNNTFVFGWAAAMPEWTSLFPPGLAVRAVAAANGWSAAGSATLMLGEICGAVAIGFAVLHRQLRHGVVTAGAREAVARRPREVRPAAADVGPRWALLSVVQRRELRLLGRDRNFMAQTLVMPAVMVGIQFVNGGPTNVFHLAVDNPQFLGVIAFMLAAYALMFSAFQTLNAEGQALWILYSIPQSLESILWQKATLWAAVATVYPAILFAFACAAAGGISVQFAGVAAVVLLGVPIFAVIATALGVFGCNPLAQQVQRRVRPTFLQLYMVLASLYGYAIFASTIWQRAAMMVLTALLAVAFWQKARDRYDYLLDPTAAPPARVSVADGLIAALLFFVLQAVVAIAIQSSRFGMPAAATLWLAFCVAGALTFGIMRLVYWRAHTAGVPVIFGPGLSPALLWGVAGGIAASFAGMAYIAVTASMGLLPAHQTDLFADHRAWLAALAVAAAPVFEEFIFRGLIFGGLRRSYGLGAATLASAAIFAIIHPPMSVVPVFVMGVCAALIYERTRMLAAPMMVHAIYNAAVLGFQWNLMQ